MNAAPPLLSRKILLPFIIVTLIWGSTWIVIRDQLGVVPPSWSVTYRFALSALVMFIVAAATRQKIWLGRSALAFALLFGIAQFVFNFNFVYRAEQHVTSGLVAVVFALLFVPNAVFGRIFLGHAITARFAWGSLLAIIGLALLFVNEARSDPGQTTQTLIGIGFTLAGVFSASIANVMQATKRAHALPMASLLAWGMLAGAILDGGFAWVTAGPPQFEWRLGYALGIGYLGIVASAIAFTLYFGLIRQIGPARAAYSSVIIPVIAMLFSTLFEDYRWTWLALAGGAVALIGMLVALSARKPSA